MVAHLEAADISVSVEAAIYPNGRFARHHDLGGNSIQLWEAAGTDLSKPRDRINQEAEQAAP